MQFDLQKAFLTFFYTGFSPKAPGTAGSIAGVLVALLILKVFNLSRETLFLLTIFVSLIAFTQINKYEESSNTHDSKEIVIDEVVGVWVAIAFTSGSYFEIIFSLIFFRIFDIWKPSLIGKIDKETKGAAGVLGDDLLAGLVAAICSVALYKFIGIYLV